MTTRNPAVYDHGITQGGSDALDAQTLWIFAAVRPLHQPQLADTSAGAAVFGQYCATCHGGPKWTKSEIFHRDNAAAAIALGADGFNVPSLLSINYSAPYLHRGQAQTLEEVFPLHGLGPQGVLFPPTTTIATTLTGKQ